MIPLQLSLSGFLSYRDPVELDFTTFELACIAGSNGAGKSSLLDAITWALFGQARKRDDAVINLQCETADVCFTFEYEGNIYRVQRSKPRDKTTVLEFHILQGVNNGQQSWKPLTERTLRETEARIQSTLRMDYETFVNAAFFLQGKADQFTQQRPGDRKRILGSVLGLEIWETYRQRTVERRKGVEAEIAGLEGRLKEITVELDEEGDRKERLERLEAELERMTRERALHETTLGQIRKIAATLAEQRKLVETLSRQVAASERMLRELRERAASRQEERQTYDEILSRAGEIEAAYQAWQEARAELERWEEVAGRFREQEKRREGPREEIQVAQARLEQEQQNLQAQQRQAEAARQEIAELEETIVHGEANQARLVQQLERRSELDEQLQSVRDRQADARAENPRLRAEMTELKERIEQLNRTDGAECPVCGQPLQPEERLRLVTELSEKGREMGDRYRANQAALKTTESELAQLEKELAELAEVEAALLVQTQQLGQTTNRQELLERSLVDWQDHGAPRLQEVTQALQEERFAEEARARLAEVDSELKAIGYDAAAHDATRKAEQSGRASEVEMRALEQARAALTPVARELAELQGQIERQEAEVERQDYDFREATAALAAAEAQAPDLEAAEKDFLSLKENENRLRMEVGAARQEVLVLDDLKERRKHLQVERAQRNEQVQQLRQLERAFGKDGVPALLIEQALPQIESKANEILDRLSGGNMSVRFVTQTAYKDRKRDDLRETLDIQISDGVGSRDYEMFSGGEAFRVNFAIRLALSEVLAQRAGARLQTLVIDEGFGSQDAQGRQRLLEAINQVRPDFEKILVISHIDELKDAFPNRIEVEKTEQGSMLKVV